MSTEKDADSGRFLQRGGLWELAKGMGEKREDDTEVAEGLVEEEKVEKERGKKEKHTRHNSCGIEGDEKSESIEAKDEKIVSMKLKGRGPLSVKKLSKFKEKHDNTGVVYLSTIPPFMRVQKLRSILSQYGRILRIYLTPEDAAITRKRKKYRKNRRVKHTDGWVEFANKKVAKKVALALNNTPIGGKKRDYYSEDRWNMKYLKRFKWSHLTEKIAVASQVKHQKIRNSSIEAQKETKFYLEKADQSKAVAAMKRKRKPGKFSNDKSKQGEGGGWSVKKSKVTSGSSKEKDVRRTFKQRELL